MVVTDRQTDGQTDKQMDNNRFVGDKYLSANVSFDMYALGY